MQIYNSLIIQQNVLLLGIKECNTKATFSEKSNCTMKSDLNIENFKVRFNFNMLMSAEANLMHSIILVYVITNKL